MLTLDKFVTKKTSYILILMGIYLLAYAIQSNFLLSWDVGWLLLVTKRLLAGGSYVTDFFETNPPLILYLYMPTVLLSKTAAIPIFAALRIYIFILASFSLGLSFVLLKKIFLETFHSQLWLLLLLLASILLLLPLYEFGQREHLLILLTFPYFLLVICRLKNIVISARLAICVGIFAGLGFGLKPFFLSALVFVEAFYLFKRRKFIACVRPETAAIVVLLLTYLVSTYYFFPNYFSIIVPFTFKHFYGIKNLSLSLHLPLVGTSLAALVIYFLQRGSDRDIVFSTVFLLGMLGFLTSYAMQRTISYYHIYPAFALSLFLLVYWFNTIFQHDATSKMRLSRILIGLVVLVFMHEYYIPYPDQARFILNPEVVFLFFSCVLFIFFYCAQVSRNPFGAIMGTAVIIAIGIYFYYMSMLTEVTSAYNFLITFFLSFTLFYLILNFNKSVTEKLKYFLMALVAAAIFYIPFVFIFDCYQLHVIRKLQLNNLIAYLQENTKNKDVYFITTSPHLAQPALDYSQANYTSRFSFFWMALAIKKPSYTQQQYAQDSKLIGTMVADDFKKHPPLFVFVDKSNHDDFLDKIHFNLINYLSNSQNFKKEWQGYCQISSVTDLIPGNRMNWPYKFDIYKPCRS
jgi:hypothetical protein